MKILYLEDDESNRLVVQDMLGVAGATMVEAESPRMAVAMLGAEPVNLVLADLRLAGLDGIAAIRGACGRQVPVVAVTADLAAHLRQRCLDAGADEVISKPVAMDTLFALLARHAGTI